MGFCVWTNGRRVRHKESRTAGEMFPLVAHYLQGALGAEAFGSEPGISGAPWYDGRKKDQVEAGRGACEEIGAPSSDRPLLMEGAIQAGGGCILQPRPRFGCRGYVRPDHAGALDRYFLYREPADRRQSFDGLGGQVRRGLKRDPISGNALVFIHRRRTPGKLFLGDRNDWDLFYKRLEAGPFERPKNRVPSAAETEIGWTGSHRPWCTIPVGPYRRREAPAGSV